MTNCESKDELLLLEWQTCVEMANYISQRRDTMNNFFITMNLAIMAAVSIVWDIKSVLILIAGVVICVLWILLINNYKKINAVKFEIINEMEKGLPYPAFNEEWEKLKDRKTYIDCTKLEKFLPILFIILYIVTALIIFVIK